MKIEVTVLGSSGMWGTVERACSGYLVRVAGKLLWMDAGSGSWRNLLRFADYRVLDGIILSHRHPDHTTDVLQAFHARHYGPGGPMAPVPVWTTSETAERLTSYSRESADAFDYRVVKPGDSASVGETRLSFFEMAHPPETVGIRVEHGGAVLAYTSDTGPGGDFEGLAGGADMLIAEATFQAQDPPWDGHLSAGQAAEVGARMAVDRLVLTHLPPGRDHHVSLAEARAAAAGLDVLLAEDGMRLEVGS